jgi:hypothetical protein
MRVLVLFTAALLFTGCAGVSPQTRAPRARQQETAGAFDIHAVKTRLIGRTALAVVRDLGTPDHEFGSAHWEWWTYEHRFYDSVTRRTLPAVTLVFHKGKVVDVTY